MLNRTLRPLTRSIRSLSTSTSTHPTRTQSTRTNLYLGTLAASIGLISVGYAGVVSDNKRVWNDATGSGNWDEKKHQYNEDLKVNRHKSELGGEFVEGVRGVSEGDRADLVSCFVTFFLFLLIYSVPPPPCPFLPLSLLLSRLVSLTLRPTPSRRSTRSDPRIPSSQQ